MKLEGIHTTALMWFANQQGNLIPAPGKLEDSDLFLAQTAKAIHVPRGWSHALSIKSLPDGPYDDGDLEIDKTGRWSLRYHQEEQKDKDPERLPTHKGLKQCLTDGVPVSVLIRRQNKPQKTLYEVIGLGRVVPMRKSLLRHRGACGGLF